MMDMKYDAMPCQNEKPAIIARDNRKFMNWRSEVIRTGSS